MTGLTGRSAPVALPVVACALLVSLQLACCQSGPGHTASDAELLLAFKASFTNGDAVLSSWNGTNPCINWKGVNCTGGQVSDLALEGQEGARLQGTVPASGWELPQQIETLDLRRNNISGTLPAEWKLPQQLKYFGLSFNQMSGTLPPTLRFPDSLDEIAIAWNRITGRPTALTLPPNVTKVSLDNNQLTGTLSTSWVLPRSLKWLDIAGNKLTGTLPADWDLPQGMNGDFKPLVGSFSGLSLHNNSLSGPLPTWPKLANASVFIKPGNPELCGEVPSAPLYSMYGYDVSSYDVFNFNISVWGTLSFRTNVTDLPSCSAAGTAAVAVPSEGGSSSSGGGGGSANVVAIIGGAVGGVCVLALAAALALWGLQRRQKRVAAREARDVEKAPAFASKPEELERGSRGVVGSSLQQQIKKGWGGKERPSVNLSNAPSIGSDVNGVGPGTPPVVSVMDAQHPGRRAGSQHEVGSSGSEEGSQSALLANDPLLASIVAQLGSGPLLKAGSSSSRRAAAAAVAAARGLTLKVDVSAWLIPFETMTLKKQIGGGSFGRVYLAEWNQTLVAVKLLLSLETTATVGDVQAVAKMVLSCDNPVLSNLEQEASVMAALRHPNIVQFIGMCTSPPCLVSEYCPAGSLFDMLRRARKSPELGLHLTWMKRLRMAMGAALGMLHLHSRSPAIVHRDLKSPNLLIGASWTVKVSDFNLSKLTGEGSMGSSSVCVTNPRWLAPEVLTGDEHTFASDVYSYGVVLWELMTFEGPWEDCFNPWQVSNFVTGGRRLPIPQPEDVPGGGFEGFQGYVELMQKCWAQKPEDRPTFTEVLGDLRLLAMLAAKQQQQQDGSVGMPTTNPATNPASDDGGSGPARVEAPATARAPTATDDPTPSLPAQPRLRGMPVRTVSLRSFHERSSCIAPLRSPPA